MKNRIQLLFILCIFTLVSKAQHPHKIDSIKYELKKLIEQEKKMGSETLADSVFLNRMNKLCMDLSEHGDFAALRRYADTSFALAEKLGFTKGMAVSYHHMGVTYWHFSDYYKAIEYYQKALMINKKINNNKGIAWDLGDIGFAYISLSNYPKALDYFQQALTINKQIKRQDAISWNYRKIGTIYTKLSEYDKAMKYFQNALTLDNQLGDKGSIAANLLSIGKVYADLSNYARALEYYQKAIKVFEDIYDAESIARALNEIGKVHIYLGNYIKAIEYLQRAEKIEEKIGDKEIIATTLISLGTIYQKQNKLNEALEYECKGLALALQSGNKENVKAAYASMAITDSAMGNLGKAFEHYKLYTIYKDSVFNIENSKKISQLENAKNQVADSLKFAQAKEVAEIKLQKQKAITYGGFIGIAVTMILLFFLYHNYRKQRLANHQLKETQQQLINSEKMAAFGIMASRVAHEIQNPLNFVNNFTTINEELIIDLLNAKTEEEKQTAISSLVENLKKVHHHGKRAEAIVTELQKHIDAGTAQEFFEEK